VYIIIEILGCIHAHALSSVRTLKGNEIGFIAKLFILCHFSSVAIFECH